MTKKTNFNDSYLIIKNRHFSETQNNLNQYIQYSALARISFINCTFNNIFNVEVIGSCNFQNCQFENFNTRKSLFVNCQLSNCQFLNCNMPRVEFVNTSFTDCKFVQVNLLESDFRRCKFEKTKFIKSNLTLLSVDDIQICKFDNLIQVENIDDFKKLLEDTSFG